MNLTHYEAINETWAIYSHKSHSISVEISDNTNLSRTVIKFLIFLSLLL